MSIRLKQTLLMLAIALLPVVISALQSQRQIEHMASAIAVTARAQELDRERHYLREKVADIGTSLRLVGSLTEELLQRQVEALESALDSPEASDRAELLASRGLAAEDAERPSFLVADPDCDSDCKTAIAKLAGAAEALKAIQQAADPFSLWHYAGLDNGVHMVFPAHGDYPEEFDPRQRPWYRVAMQRGRSWLPLTIDASTRQPVLTLTAPLRGANGIARGATGIDLPLATLLSFQSETAPWLNVAELSLLHLGTAGELRVIARQQAMQAESDWRSAEQTELLEGLDPAKVEKLRLLGRGDSLLFEDVERQGETWNLAITAIGIGGDSWRALFSPHSATEAAVAAA